MNNSKYTVRNIRQKVESSSTGSVRTLFVLIVGAPILLALTALIVMGLTMIKDLPSAKELATIKPRLATRVLDDQGQYVASFFVENREWLALDSIKDTAQTRRLMDAVIMTEDRRFRDHWGMNVWAIPSALIQSAIGGDRLRGASTLTQQLAKNLFLTSERSLNRKLKEVMASVLIERNYNKDEIFELYINQVYMGAGCYGFQAASKYYFNKSLQEASLSQLAILAGLLRSPETLRPDKESNSERVRKRRNTVLRILLDEKKITQSEYEAALGEAIEAKGFQQKLDSGMNIGQYYIEEVRKQMQADTGLANFYSEGLVVQTEMNAIAQKAMEKAVHDQLDFLRKSARKRYAQTLKLDKLYAKGKGVDFVVKNWDDLYPRFLKEFVEPDRARAEASGERRKYPDSILYQDLQAGAVMIENRTGAIKAMVGGYDFMTSKFNRAMQAVRQPGSAFKPFVYSVAVRAGKSPADKVNDQVTPIQDPNDPSKMWNPANYDRSIEGLIPMRRALYLSKNLPVVNMVQEYGPASVMQMARSFGITEEMNPIPAIGLGVFGVNVLEMASAYSVYPNLGYRMEPYMVGSIRLRDGGIVSDHKSVRHDGILDPESSYLMLDMLRDVVRRGTAFTITRMGFRIPSGGKTGTTDDYTDAWYVGFTEKYTMAVWVGYDDSRPMGSNHTGGEVAAPIWAKTMFDVYAKSGLKTVDFPPLPPGLEVINACGHMEVTRRGGPVPYCEPVMDTTTVDTTTTGDDPFAGDETTDEIPKNKPEDPEQEDSFGDI